MRHLLEGSICLVLPHKSFQQLLDSLFEWRGGPADQRLQVSGDLEQKAGGDVGVKSSDEAGAPPNGPTARRLQSLRASFASSLFLRTGSAAA
jgi:hypothetical protein